MISEDSLEATALKRAGSLRGASETYYKLCSAQKRMTTSCRNSRKSLWIEPEMKKRADNKAKGYIAFISIFQMRKYVGRKWFKAVQEAKL